MDTNGNTIASVGIDSSGNYYSSDELGSTFTTKPIAGGTEYDFAGGNGPASVQVIESNINISFPASCGNGAYSGNTYTAPTSIKYYDGTTLVKSYSFTYGTTGQIAQVTLPTGGTIKYTHTGALNCVLATSSGLNRQLSADNTNWSPWSYTVSGSLPATSSTTITTANNDVTVVNFAYYNEVSRTIKSGSSTVLETITHCYNYSAASSCTTASGPTSQVQSSAPPKALTTLIAYNGGSSHISNVVYHGDGFPYATEVDDYDYDGTIQRKTLTPHGTYNSNGTCAAIGGNVFDRVCYKNITNGAVPITQWWESTTFTYDSRGNLLTVNRNTGSTWLTTTYTHNANGSVATIKDPSGATTTFSSPACSGFLPQSTTNDKVTWNTSTTYDCAGAVILSSTDPNGNVTNYGHADPFWRLTSVTSPYQGTSTATMTYSYGTNTTTATMSVGGTSSEQSVHQVDGLGRPFVDSTLTSATGGPYSSVSYAYDADGRLQSKSAPCASTDWKTACSGSGTSLTYDAANRVLTITDPVNGTLTNTYSFSSSHLIETSTLSPAIEGTTNAEKDYQLDGLGRTVALCDRGSASSLTNSASCGTWSGNGYLTTYTYDPANRLTSTSGAAGGRTFAYDWLGRLLSEANPESGTTTYAYDVPTTACPYSSPQDLIQRTDNAGNITCYTYDFLHRLYDVSGGRHFRYDTPSSLPTGVSVSNTLGRMVEAYTDSPATDEWFSYETSGKMVDMYEMTPSSGGYMHTTASFYEDGQVQSVAAVPGLNQAWNFGLGTYGELNTVSDTTSGTIVTGITRYANHSPNTVTFANSSTDVYQYDAAGRMTSSVDSIASGSVTTTLTWNANGTLGTYQVADTFHTAENKTCNFTYDDIVRLVNTGCGTAGSQAYSYDQFGNISKTANGIGLSFQPLYNSANQITNMNFVYDGNGNVTNDGFDAYTYDPVLNKVTSVTGAGTPLNGTCITYDALGRMVDVGNQSNTNPPVCTSGGPILYSPVGKIAVLGIGGTYQSGSKVHIPTPVGDLEYIYGTNSYARVNHPDWLGSVRFTTNPHLNSFSSGADYAPFGEINSNWGSVPRGDFTGQDHFTAPDGSYDFPARKYSSVQSRWFSPDPTIGSLSDPQSFNKYGYVSNNPLALTDSSGLCAAAPGEPCNGHWERLDSGIEGAGMGCSIDGIAASCAAVSAFADIGGGGEIGVICATCSAFGYGTQWSVTSGGELMKNIPSSASYDPDEGDGPLGAITKSAQWLDMGPASWSAGILPFGLPSPAANNGNFSWWGAFAKNLFSWKNFTAEFKQGGCVNVFGKATADALNPFSPSLSSAGEGTAAVLAASKYNAAVQYAASAPNYLGGTGLIYPMKSSVVRGMIADANATAASGGMMSVDLALAQGFGTEMYSMATGGCH